MKVSKKIISYLLIAAMIITTFNYSAVGTNAATALKLRSSKKVTMVVGDSGKLISTNVASSKLTYKTSNKKVATVSKTGKIKPVSAGVAKITVKAKDGSGSVKVKVTVNPGKVKGVSATEVSNTSIKVSWKKAKNVTGYEVYQSTSANGTYKKVATVKSASTTFNNLAPSKTYYYKVKAYRKVGSKKYVSELSGNNKNEEGGTTRQSAKKYANSAKTYQLKWSDEFNYTDIEKIRDNWVYEVGIGPNADGWGNAELEYYTDGENVALQNGSLILFPKYDSSNSERPITSARLTTYGKRTFKYGKIEFRAKLPSLPQAWAACWMLGNGNRWPRTGEIDVFETLYGHANLVPQSIHCWKYCGMKGHQPNKHGDTLVSTSSTEYHTYAAIWTENAITFTIDGKETWTYNPLKYTRTVNEDVWPFDQPFYLIMNVAIGGTLGGGNEIITKNNLPALNTDSAKMYIDYVRVYQ